jgi:hypothetical protein
MSVGHFREAGAVETAYQFASKIAWLTTLALILRVCSVVARMPRRHPHLVPCGKVYWLVVGIHANGASDKRRERVKQLSEKERVDVD